MRKTSLIVGNGEIGSGLFKVLDDAYGDRVFIRDIGDPEWTHREFDYLHITIPYSKEFKTIVKAYIKLYKPSIVVIHSTVKPGTTKRISRRAIHSPIRGKHPLLAESIKTFVKFIGYDDNEPLANEMAEYFIEAGIPTITMEDTKTTELLKIVSTTLYGWQIVAAKEVNRLCDKYGVNFENVYSVANQTYNDGYEKLGMGQFRKPSLAPTPGKIGGHCVVPNTRLINDFFTDLVKSCDKTY